MNRFIILFLVILNTFLCLYVFKLWNLLATNKHNDLSSTNDWKSTETNQSKIADVFIATDEWQPVKKDQPIPKGLHVRINLQTGERQAKLLSKENMKEIPAKKTSVSLFSKNNFDYKKSSYLQEAVKKIINETNDDETNENQLKKFRTIEELKKEAAELNMNVKTDIEILSDILKNFHENYKFMEKWCSLEEHNLISMFDDLENLLHQVDNAIEFSKQNGMTDIIAPCLSSNSTKMKINAARVLGAAVQNNARVQISALRAGVIPLLLKNIALKKNYDIRAASIFALSCLVRSFPFAEMKMIDEGGLSVLLSLFDESTAESLKLQMKVVTFFYDLITEKENAEISLKEDVLLNNTIDNTVIEELKLAAEKLKQYNNLGLKSKLVELGWCVKLSNLLVDRVSKISVNTVDHDVLDKILNAVLSVAVECHDQFQNKEKFYESVIKLLQYYKELSIQDDFFLSMYTLAHQLYEKLNLK